MGSSTDSVNGNDDLVSEFDASTCSGENIYEIFEKEDEMITENSIVWVNTNEKKFIGRVTNIPCSELLQDYNYLKFIWIYKGNEDKVLIKIFQEIQTKKLLYQLITINMEGS